MHCLKTSPISCKPYVAVLFKLDLTASIRDVSLHFLASVLWFNAAIIFRPNLLYTCRGAVYMAAKTIRKKTVKKKFKAFHKLNNIKIAT